MLMLAMTTVQQEDIEQLRTELQNYVRQRIAIQKVEEEGFRLELQDEIEEIRDSLAQGGSAEERLQSTERILE